MECLVEAKCNLDIQNNEGETPLHIAAARGHYDILCYLCDHGASIDKQDKVNFADVNQFIYLFICRMDALQCVWLRGEDVMILYNIYAN